MKMGVVMLVGSARYVLPDPVAGEVAVCIIGLFGCHWLGCGDTPLVAACAVHRDKLLAAGALPVLLRVLRRLDVLCDLVAVQVSPAAVTGSAPAVYTWSCLWSTPIRCALRPAVFLFPCRQRSIRCGISLFSQV